MILACQQFSKILYYQTPLVNFRYLSQFNFHTQRSTGVDSPRHGLVDGLVVQVTISCYRNPLITELQGWSYVGFSFSWHKHPRILKLENASKVRVLYRSKHTSPLRGIHGVNIIHHMRCDISQTHVRWGVM